MNGEIERNFNAKEKGHSPQNFLAANKFAFYQLSECNLLDQFRDSLIYEMRDREKTSGKKKLPDDIKRSFAIALLEVGIYQSRGEVESQAVNKITSNFGVTLEEMFFHSEGLQKLKKCGALRFKH